MVSFRAFLALASAVAVSADYFIQPDSVSPVTRKAWCNDQRSSCKPICLETSPGSPRENTCDWETLTYSCVCSDGNKPNVSEYSLTLPYHTCTEWGNQCVKGCGSNECASSCRQDNPCGAQSPTRVNETTAASTSAGPEATSAPTDQVFSGLADGSGNGDGENAAGVLRFGDSYGLAVVAGGLFAGFAMLL